MKPKSRKNDPPCPNCIKCLVEKILKKREERRKRMATPFRHRRIPESAEVPVTRHSAEIKQLLNNQRVGISSIPTQSTQTSVDSIDSSNRRRSSSVNSRPTPRSEEEIKPSKPKDPRRLVDRKTDQPSTRDDPNFKTTSAWHVQYHTISEQSLDHISTSGLLTPEFYSPAKKVRISDNPGVHRLHRSLSLESLKSVAAFKPSPSIKRERSNSTPRGIPAVRQSPHRHALASSIPIDSGLYEDYITVAFRDSYLDSEVWEGCFGRPLVKAFSGRRSPTDSAYRVKAKHGDNKRSSSCDSLYLSYKPEATDFDDLFEPDPSFDLKSYPSDRNLYGLNREQASTSGTYPSNKNQSFSRQIVKDYEEKRGQKKGKNNCSHQPMGRMNPLEDHERKVIIEFCHLLEKSKQLFNGLRELPQYGHKQWHSYFGRTFDVYTKLWKFQQQHRAILDSKYGLKRWQIGEIASKIGQLYYHFYLRTSETAYLNEAFSFYYAIRGRCYYTKACKEDKCELMVKKLRYYARFIVVCLLLKKIKLVRELIKELDRQIIEYGNTYDPDDQIEWTVVVDEVKAFIHAEPVVTVIHPDNYPVILSHRLSSITTPPVERSPQMTLSLQEVLIIGSSSQQVKFSELTMDMFRMLQTLEREPSGEIQHMYDDSPRQRFISTPSAPTSKGYNIENGPRRDNPHKYLLFKPSPSQVLVYLASGCNDLPPNGALLLYISADGQIVQPSKHPEDVGYDIGGLITTSKHDIYRECNKDSKTPPSSKYKELQCLHPGDLYPFTRRPLFIIIDSDNSYVFQHIPRHFGQPLVILMSPLELPSPFHDRRQQGSLFTLFLHSPLTAFSYCCDIHNLSLVHWDRAQIYIDTFMAEASQLVTRSRIDIMYIAFMGDDFLRLLLLRFIFCEVTLRMHRAFRARTHLTRAAPPLPDDLLEHPALVHIVMDLAAHLQVRAHFHDPSTAGPPSTKE